MTITQGAQLAMTQLMATLPVAEIFGPTFQGEGRSAGQLAAFIRLGGCNLTCRACDTPYTWDGHRFDLRTEITTRTVTEIMERLPGAPLVVLTGGEPTLYRTRPAMTDLLTRLTGAGHTVEVETNGTIVPVPMTGYPGVTFNVSPKLAGPMSDDPDPARLVPAALEFYADLARHGQATVKIVVCDEVSAMQAVTLTDAYRIPRQAVWLMPEGITPDTVIDHARQVADTALALGVNLSLRQQILLWPDQTRGR